MTNVQTAKMKLRVLQVFYLGQNEFAALFAQ